MADKLPKMCCCKVQKNGPYQWKQRDTQGAALLMLIAIMILGMANGPEFSLVGFVLLVFFVCMFIGWLGSSNLVRV